MSLHLERSISINTGRVAKLSVGSPIPGSIFGGPPIGSPIGGAPGPALCALLVGRARELCEAAGSLLPSGGNGGGGFNGKKLAGGGCVFPARRDPISGQCKLFLGTQEGADPGRATVGAFGLPALVPDVVGQITRRDGTIGPILRCMRSMVLGTDNLCYPKAVLPRRSKFRKWRGDPRPAVSAGDVRAIRKAAAAKDRVLNLAKDVGLFASKSRPSPKAKPHQHLIAAAPQELRVISETTN